jgi:RNA polymerase sigma-70 factor (ECF subfamily)
LIALVARFDNDVPANERQPIPMDKPALAGGPSLELFREELAQMVPRLRGFARSYCGSAADADDAVQLTCERALNRWQQWSGEGSLEHWLFKILINAWRDECRSRRVRAASDVECEDLVQGCEESALEALYLDQVRAEIMKLPDGQREVLLLVAGEGLSYRETSDLLGIPVGTVMSRLSRARQALIETLGESDD